MQMLNLSSINRFSKSFSRARPSDVCDASGFLRLFFCREASDCSVWILGALELEQVSTWGPKPVKKIITVKFPVQF
ncbi:hypothetical protein ABMA28_001078 [Loxostege sticticalis]|uniref:Uncharacterized protein n=1 Tax=Loxostege sticticalis TaxID=481309 RepID=A0ABD0T7B8_LOXSC